MRTVTSILDLSVSFASLFEFYMSSSLIHSDSSDLHPHLHSYHLPNVTIHPNQSLSRSRSFSHLLPSQPSTRSFVAGGMRALASRRKRSTRARARGEEEEEEELADEAFEELEEEEDEDGEEEAEGRGLSSVAGDRTRWRDASALSSAGGSSFVTDAGTDEPSEDYSQRVNRFVHVLFPYSCYVKVGTSHCLLSIFSQSTPYFLRP